MVTTGGNATAVEYEVRYEMSLEDETGEMKWIRCSWKFVYALKSGYACVGLISYQLVEVKEKCAMYIGFQLVGALERLSQRKLFFCN